MNIVIVEDETHTASLLQEIIEQNHDFMVIEKLESVAETIPYLVKYQQNIDLLFFDIQLADGPSFEIFKHVDVNVPVVFCTAFEEYPMQAIKNNGIDYVLKPFKEEEIHQALEKYKQLKVNLQKQPNTPLHIGVAATKKYQQNFFAQYKEKSIIVPVNDIALFQIEHETVYLYNFEGQKYPVYKKLEYIESVCDPTQFFRINRQMLIHKKAVESFIPYSNRKIVLQLVIELDGPSVVSRLKVSPFKKWLEQ